MTTYAAPADGASPAEVRKWRSSRAAASERALSKQAEEQKAIDDAQQKEQREKERAKLVLDLRYWSRHQKFSRAQDLLQRAAVFIERKV